MSLTKQQQKDAIGELKNSGRIDLAVKKAGVTRRQFEHSCKIDPDFEKTVSGIRDGHRKKLQQDVLRQIRLHGSQTRAAEAVGINKRTIWWHRKHYPEFSDAFDKALKHFQSKGRQS